MVRISGETIHIENLRVSGVIGIHPEERIRRQPLIVNVALEQDFSRAAESDEIGHTVDYTKLCAAIRAFVEAHSFHLLETLIRRLALHLSAQFPFSRLTLHIRKPEAIAAADAAAVSLTVTRDAPAGP